MRRQARSIPSTAANTNHAKWSPGSHSVNDSGINNTCPRSHDKKFWGMPRIVQTTRTAGPLCNSLTRE